MDPRYRLGVSPICTGTSPSDLSQNAGMGSHGASTLNAQMPTAFGRLSAQVDVPQSPSTLSAPKERRTPSHLDFAMRRYCDLPCPTPRPTTCGDKHIYPDAVQARIKRDEESPIPGGLKFIAIVDDHLHWLKKDRQLKK
jgi:hypothetical protein